MNRKSGQFICYKTGQFYLLLTDAKVGIFSVIPRAQHEKVSPLFDPEHHLVDLRQILQQFLLMFIHSFCTHLYVSVFGKTLRDN